MSLIERVAGSVARFAAEPLQRDHMRTLGIANTMAVARRLNDWAHGRRYAYRRRLYRTGFEALIRENGPERGPVPEMRDGYAIDTSMSLPHLDRLLADAAVIIKERAGPRRPRVGKYRNVFRDIQEPGDHERFPSILDFALSSEVLRVISRHLQCVPALLEHLPGGLRFAE